ncbi:phospholipase D family protein [Ferrimonas balearica]|uniref:phospholipase D family protein n=1 Tax=Ferrimonas balearica TaxID=44012 RepID=UPI0021BD1069|nr:phospholipase D family protein [Ferrimonas balearica]
MLLGMALLLVGCAGLPDNTQRQDSRMIRDVDDTLLGRLTASMTESRPGLTGIYELGEPINAFVARLAMIETAEKSLDLQYYIWHDDMTGRLLHNRLLQAADRGVRVRLLLDDLDTAGKDTMLHLLDAHPNIEIRLFNPFPHRGSRLVGFATDFGRLNRRMHNKTITADNSVTVLGGRNIGDEYFNADDEVVFGDLDVLCVGVAVEEVSIQFDLYWNSPWAYPMALFREGPPITEGQQAAFRRLSDAELEVARESRYADALKQTEMARADALTQLDLTWGVARVVYDDPGKVGGLSLSTDTHLAPELLKSMATSENDLLIISPYFVPGDRMVAYFDDMVRRGIRVRIVTNSLAANDVPVVHAGYSRRRQALVASGVELYEYKVDLDADGNRPRSRVWQGASRGSLHAKTLTFDQRFMFVGSFNLDARSVLLNTEIGVLFESPTYAQRLSDNVEANGLIKAYRLELEEDELRWVTLEADELVRYDTEPDTSWWDRFSNSVLRWFVPESQL